MAVFVLGAGATRGASFVDPLANPCLPPLDADFFTILQRLRKPKNRRFARLVLEDVVETFGSNFRVTMEDVFSTYEQAARISKVVSAHPGADLAKFSIKQFALEQSVGALFEEAMTERGPHGEATHRAAECKYHRKLVESILAEQDSIISFNYDCLIDDALRDCGSGKWNARYGYCIPLRKGGSGLKGDEHWQPEKRSSKDNSICLLKLHGSLHFDATSTRDADGKEEHSVKLKRRPYARKFGTQRFTIIPPESTKRYDRGIFSVLWREAATKLRSARDLIVIGYSLPHSDLHASSLFRICVKPNSLRSLVVVNPDPNARRRIRDVVQSALRKDTRVLSVSTLKEFCAIERDTWAKP